MKLNKNISHYGDILAIPCFLITLIYFYRINNKSTLEILIMFFIFVCLIGDILFTIQFLHI
jgi:hypothetical protein